MTKEQPTVPDVAARTVLLTDEHCTVATATGLDHVVVEISGEVDLANADDVYAALHPLIAQRPTRLDIDLSTLEFIDSFGISRLIMAQQVAMAAGVPVSIIRTRPSTRRVFVVSGLIDFLNVE